MPQRHSRKKRGSLKSALSPIPDSRRCIRCGGEIPLEMLSNSGAGNRYCSPECLKWAGDSIHDWAKLRAKILKRDGFVCRRCGARETRRVIPWREDRVFPLEVHHIKPLIEGGPRFDSANCITLCHDCHCKEHFQIAPIRRMHRTLDSF